MIEAKLIKVDGGVMNVTVGGLKDVQKLVGGYVGTVFTKSFVLMFDEDGKAFKKKPNYIASKLLESNGVKMNTQNMVVGDAVTCSRSDFDSL